MDSAKRFDQLESLLVDLARKVDQQAEQIAQIIQVLNRQGQALASQSEAIASQSEAIASQSEAIAHQGEAIARQEVRLDNIGDQIGDIINILKISESRHTEVEQRQNGMLTEIRQQGQRQDVAVEALKTLLKRQQTTDTRLDGVVQAQLQTLQLLRADADRIDGQEPRIKRLEDEAFRAAS